MPYQSLYHDKIRELSQLPPETRRNILRRVVQMLIFDSLIALFCCFRWKRQWLYAGYTQHSWWLSSWSEGFPAARGVS